MKRVETRETFEIGEDGAEARALQVVVVHRGGEVLTVELHGMVSEGHKWSEQRVVLSPGQAMALVHGLKDVMRGGRE